MTTGSDQSPGQDVEDVGGAGVRAVVFKARRVLRFAPLLLCWLGFALRVFRLDAQPLWFDEWLTVDLALAPPRYVLQTIDRPPMYYVLLHAWTLAA